MAFTSTDIIFRNNGKNFQGKAMLFDTHFDYIKFIEDINPTLIGKSRIQYDLRFKGTSYLEKKIKDIDWYGTNDIDKVSSPINTYLFNEDLKIELDKFDKKIEDINLIDLQQKKKIIFTSQEIGIFSFDLASLGLIPVVEYYSPLLNEIVSGDMIRSYKTNNGDLIFYHIFVAEVPQHYLEQKSGKLFSPILDIFINENSPYVVKEIIDGKLFFIHLKINEIPRHDVQQRQVIGENGLPKFSSTWKKSFIYVPQIPFELPQIDILIQTSFDYTRKARKEMFWTAVAVNAIIEKLSKANVKFRVYSGSSSAIKADGDKIVSFFTKLKDLNDPININNISMLSSDPRLYRYEKFKFIICSAFYLGYGNDLTNSLAFPINDSSLTKESFIELIKNKKDYGSSMEDSLNPNTKIIINACLSEQQAQETFNIAIRQIKNLEQTP